MQLKDDLRRCAERLKESAESFKNAVEDSHQVLSGLIDACLEKMAISVIEPQIGQAQASHDDRYMTAKEVADYLQVSEATIYSWATANKIPSFRKKGMVRFLKSAIDDWMNQHEETIERSCLRVVESRRSSLRPTDRRVN